MENEKSKQGVKTKRCKKIENNKMQFYFSAENENKTDKYLALIKKSLYIAQFVWITKLFFCVAIAATTF